VRRVKLLPKLGGCFRTKDAARAFCRVRSYLSTVRKQRHSLLSSLERAFNGKPLDFHPPKVKFSSTKYLNIYDKPRVSLKVMRTCFR
jgi:hypothetical protein